MRSRVEGTYVAEKEDERQSEDEEGDEGGYERVTHVRQGLIVAFTSADSRRIERKRRGRTEREKKMPDSQDPRGLPPGAANARTPVMRKRFRAG